MFVSKKKTSNSNWLKIKSRIPARSPLNKSQFIDAILPTCLYRDSLGLPIFNKAVMIWSSLIGKIPTFAQGVYYKGFKNFELTQLAESHACFIGSDRIKSENGVVVSYILKPSHYLDYPDNRLIASVELREFPKDLVQCVTCILTHSANGTISLEVVEIRNLKAVSCQTHLPLGYNNMYPMRAW